MSALVARVVDTDGQLGVVLGTSSYEGVGLVHYGGNVIAATVGRMAAGGRRTEREAFDLLAGEAWSNGKVWIGAAS